MTHATESSPPESERLSQRRLSTRLFPAEEATTVAPAHDLQRREPSRPCQITLPEEVTPPDNAIALIAFTTGAVTGSVLRIEPRSALSIGRGERCSVQIDDPTISRTHAMLHRLDSSVSLIDAGSTNGTFVNGRRVEAAVTLRSGDSVRLGTRHGFRFLMGDEHELAALSAAYEHATRDGLTGLLNRRMFDQALDGEIAFARRHSSGLALLLIDIDRFKIVNDSHGHVVGDWVLRSIGEQLREAVRAEDIAARVGGEEFGVVARDIDTPGVLALAERLAARIGELRVNAGSCSVRVTVSIGIALLAECDAPQGAEELLRLADIRLYKAKRNRNCVVAG